MRARAALLAVAVAAGAVTFVAGGPGRASAADSSTAPGVSAQPGLQLVSQTPYVSSTGTFHLQLKVETPDPATDTVNGIIYSRLTSRSGFDQTVAGHVHGGQIFFVYSPPVATLPADASGAVGIDIPVNQSSVRSFGARSGSAVYPVVLQLHTRAGVPLGKPLTTFLVYSSGPSSSTPRLAVSLTVPVSGPVDASARPTRLPAAASSGLATLAGVLAANTDIPLTVAANPETLDRLAAGPPADRATLAALARSLSADQVLAAPYFPVSAAALSAAGLDAELATQYQAGSAAITAGLHRPPDTGAAVVTGGFDTDGLAAEQAAGVSRLVLPDSDLSALSSSERQITFASPTSLAGSKGTTAQVMATDPGLSAMLSAGTQPVLDGERILAGLALVQLEAPSDARAVALVEPNGAAPQADLLSTVLSGMRGNPFVEPVTADGLFRTVPAATPQITRSLVATKAAAGLTDASAVRSTGVAVAGLAAIVPSQSRLTAGSQRQLLLATSSLLSTAQRSSLLAGIAAAVRKAETGISLPGSSSVTLTARTGTIPLTVLSNPSLSARVRLRITSPKLVFHPITGCRVTDPSTETCTLTLTSEATTLRLPVESRTGGVFSMQVVLTSPDGSVVLASNRDTVRSTAFSQVGVALIVLAALGLAVWWVRNARHGRRARQLVDPRTADPTPPDGVPATSVPATSVPADTVREVEPVGVAAPPDPAPPVPPSNGHRFDLPVAEPVTTWVDDDPVIAEFFASPAPEYGDGPDPGDHVSPSGRRPGPNA